MLRHLVKAAIFSFVANLLYSFVFPLVSGMFLTYFYVPDIAQNDEHVQYLQNEVTFGRIDQPVWGMVTLLSFLSGMALYALFITGKTLFRHTRSPK